MTIFCANGFFGLYFAKIRGLKLKTLSLRLGLKYNALRTLILCFALLTCGSSLWGQSQKYVTAAQIHITATHLVMLDFFINGEPIVKSDDHSNDTVMDITQNFTKDQLCYFLDDNCVAIKVLQSLENSTKTNADIGMAYVLKITLSDNSTTLITSDQGLVTQYHHAGNEPSGWSTRDYRDTGWDQPILFDPTSMATTLINPESNALAKYFKTFRDGDNNLMRATLGEKFLFRGKFSMDVTSPPGCAPPTKTPEPALPVQVVAVPPTLTFTPVPARPTSTFTPPPQATSTFTPRPQPPTATFTIPFTWTPVPFRPTSTFTSVPVWTPRPRPTSTPLPIYRPNPAAAANPNSQIDLPAVPWQVVPPRPVYTPRPTLAPLRSAAVATPVYRYAQMIPTAVPSPVFQSRPTRVVRRVPTPAPRVRVQRWTPTPIPPTETATPAPVRKRRAAAAPIKRKPVVAPTLTPVPAPAGGGPGGSVIAFSSLPVNIDASFGDGPGVYQCEIVDSQGNHVNTIFNKRVAFEKESWISWDATNDQGRQVRYGMYYAVFTKDGKLIRKIPLNWSQGQ